MTKNLDTRGRVIRLFIGVALIFLAWWYGSWIALACGLFTLFEAISSWCAFFQLMGINHCSIEHKDDKQ